MVERTSGSGNIKKFVPFVMSSFGGLGPAAREFLTMAYRTARRSECFFLGVNHARYRLRGTRSRLQRTGMPESAWRAHRRMRSFKAVLLRMISARRGRPSAASRTLILTSPPLTLSL